MPRPGSRRVYPIKGEEHIYTYTNCIGEEFIIGVSRHDDDDVIFLNYLKERNIVDKVYYYNTESTVHTLDFMSLGGWELQYINGKEYVDCIGMDKKYTDIAKTPASALLVLNEYYKKYGYPKDN